MNYLSLFDFMSSCIWLVCSRFRSFRLLWIRHRAW